MQEVVLMLNRNHYRTKCIGVRVREADFARLQALADSEGKSLGEWCRDILLERVEAREPSPADQTVVLSEVLALRTILLNSVFKLSKRKEITEEEMNELIDRADSEKVKRAVERLKRLFTDDGRM
jgi:Mobilization protein NikA